MILFFRLHDMPDALVYRCDIVTVARWISTGLMKIHLQPYAYRLNFLNRFCSVNLVSGVRFQVSGKADAIAYPEH